MNRIIFFLIGVLAIGLFGCGSGGPETPAQGIEAIIKLLEARDFDTLVRTRYAEIAKADADDERIQGLIDMFTGRLEEPGRLNDAIAKYKSALQTEPELRDDGTVAVFTLDSGTMRLSQMPNGKWGFHL